MNRSGVLLGVVLLGAALGPACGGGSAYNSGDGATSPGGSPVPTGSGAPVTITLSATGIDAKDVVVPIGGSVLFVNKDTAAHQIASNPHPVHSDCPELNGPALAQGQSFVATMQAHAAPCGFHDHLRPADTAFQGFVTVGAQGTPTATVSATPTPTSTATPVPTATGTSTSTTPPY